ncbi:MAG: acetylglutamate kinase [Candidatus Omnitrophota bacterium]
MQDLVEKAGILIEALPYIRNFRGKEVVIKYGGAAMESLEMRANVLRDLVFMNYVGIRPILIHGGGIAITEAMKKKGIQSRFVDGLRVTDERTITTVVETLAALNQSIVSDIKKFGAEAVGLSGHDADILHVKKKIASEDVGYVGDVIRVNIEPIRKLTEKGVIPVVYGIGIGPDGKNYNINADEAAAKIAAALKVQKIMILTNVKGILRDREDAESLISSLKVEDVEQLIQTQVIQGGMIPKVNAGMTALKGGVQKAHIVDGRLPHSLLLEIFTDRGIGTEIIL